MLKWKNAFFYSLKSIKNGLIFKIVFSLLWVVLITFICLLFKIIRTDINELHIKTLLNNDAVNVAININGTSKEEQDEKIFEVSQKLQKELGINNMGFSYGIYENNLAVFWQFCKEEYYYKYYEIALWDREDYNEYIVGNLNLKLIGNMPEKANEIVISNYLADYLIKLGIIADSGKCYYLNSYEEIIKSSEKVKLGDSDLKIVGIYQDEKNVDKNEMLNYKDIEYIGKNAFKIYVNENFLKNDFEFYKKGIYIYEKDYDKLLKVFNLSDDINITTSYSEDFRSLNSTLNKVDSLIVFLLLMLLFMFCLLASIYGILSIKKQRNNFNVLRMLGAKKKDLRRIIIVQNVILSISCFLVSIGFVLGISKLFNMILSNDLGFNIIFLNLNLGDLFIVMGLNLFGLLMVIFLNCKKYNNNY